MNPLPLKMSAWGAVLAMTVLASLSAWPQAIDNSVRFATLDIYLETAEPLAAWQFELRESAGQMLVVGVENGESPAFAGTPYYDIEAVSEGRADRIVVADFTLGPAAELPTGRGRVARIHVQLSGSADPDYELRLVAAGGADGESIQASIEFETP